MQLQPDTVTALAQSMPDTWIQLLHAGPTPFAPEQWVLITPTDTAPSLYREGYLIAAMVMPS